ncbi:NAD(P)H-dependent oxidoreductase [Pediococcus pentosaceus]|jgi:FMN-dependent NADH-azoreductase|uniref:FMN-dependent NADH-azoreductase n=1 Tax=Pediococcus pentosaceus TaxID=1255 RepID=UPI00211CA645|nr:NAD(P)H-dependent oxidoreductase [Pediococcus pentosaceus]MCQ9316715.1 NAD(P)H-dependent oxidoreductase [Pediococcus pentosaceus]MCQ9339213.1 NAD(P)H-dependent oxidoreductase [Pediococcus pentosaceus]
MKTLIINTHPDFTNEERYSIKLQKLFMEKFQERFPAEQLTLLNLYDIEVPRIEKGQLMDVWQKQIAREPLSATEQAVADQSAHLLAQFKEHHRIVIVAPLHNFNVTSRMKDYMDNIMIARETFKYTEDGSVGLMTDNYRVLLLQASGSIYTNHDRYTPLEFSHFYLQKMFEEIMGFDQFSIVRAQGTSVITPQAVWANVPADMQKAFDQFYAD